MASVDWDTACRRTRWKVKKVGRRERRLDLKEWGMPRPFPSHPYGEEAREHIHKLKQVETVLKIS